MNTNKPDVLSVIEMFNGRLFKIPDYQRPYSWTEKQLKALFMDIKNAHEKEKEHFLSTIVYVKTDTKELIGSDEFNWYDVVDGQQRLTSIIILLKAIQRGLNAERDEEKEEKQNLQKMLVRGTEKHLVLLQTNHNERQILENYLKDEKSFASYSPATIPEKNLLTAFTESQKFVTEWKASGKKLVDLLATIKNRLSFLVYDLNDENIVYTVFDVLNSRGLPVIYFDKAKSLFLSQIFESSASKTYKKQYEDSIKQSWAKMYDLLGLNEFESDDILKYAATFKSNEKRGAPISCEKSLGVFQELLKNDISNIEKLSSFLEEVTKNLKKIYEDPRLKFFSNITQLRFFLIAIYMSDFSKKEKDEILEKFQIISFIIYGLYGKDSKYSVGDFIRLGKEIYDKDITSEKIKECEIENFKTLSLKDKILKRLSCIAENYPIDAIENEFKNRDCYTDWKDELRYLLYKIESYLAKEKANGKKQKPSESWNFIFDCDIEDSIEHIIPQKSTSDWKNKIGENNEYGKVVNRLGNLLLLPQGLNSECGQKKFSEKKEMYKRAKLFICDDVIFEDAKTNIERADWNYDEIINREEKYFKIIKIIFKVD